MMCTLMLLSLTLPFAPGAQAQDVTLTILNPRGSVERLPITPLAERLDTFEGMTIAAYSIGMPANLVQVQALMAERFGGPSGDNPLGVVWGSVNAKAGVDHQDSLIAYESGARAADAVIVGTAF